MLAKKYNMLSLIALFQYSLKGTLLKKGWNFVRMLQVQLMPILDVIQKFLRVIKKKLFLKV